jgi:dipeptidyl aminopeptidase/acylaminoacyl peptidase
LKKIRLTLVLLAVFGCGHPLGAQETAATSGKAPLTPEAAINIHFLTDLQLSPDATRLAFVVSEAPKGELRAQHIWMYDKKTDAVRQFTYSSKSETSPRWSSDGSQLAFLSNRGGDEQQIYLMNSSGGELPPTQKERATLRALRGPRTANTSPTLRPMPRQKRTKRK